MDAVLVCAVCVGLAAIVAIALGFATIVWIDAWQAISDARKGYRR